MQAFSRQVLNTEQYRQAARIRLAFLGTAILIESELPKSEVRDDAMRLLLESHAMASHALSHHSKGAKGVKKEKQELGRSSAEPVQSGTVGDPVSGGHADPSGGDQVKTEAIQSGEGGTWQEIFRHLESHEKGEVK